MNDFHERIRGYNLDFIFLPSGPLDVCKHFVSYSGGNIWCSINTDLKCLLLLIVLNVHYSILYQQNVAKLIYICMLLLYCNA